MKLLYLDPRALAADPNGVREDPGNVEGLAATIAEHGLLQPIGVIEAGAGRYQVVYGNRRREAALRLGLERVPCIILDSDDPRTLIQQLTENVQRQDLNDLEKARAFLRLREQLAAGQAHNEGELDEATARAVGLSARTVRRYLGLLDLPEEIQQLLRAGDLSVTQAQHLRRIPNPRTQVELAHAAVDEGMSAAELSRRVQTALAQALLDRAPVFGLSTPEWESLSQFLKTLQEPAAAEGKDERSGAGESGVIFAPSREAGRGGTVVGETRKPR